MSQNQKKSESQLEAEAKGNANPYGKVRFGIPATRTVNEKYGRTSVKMLDAFVPVTGTGMVLVSAIYAGLERKGDGVSVVPSGYLPGKVFKPESEGASDAFLSHLESAAIAWPGYGEALDASAALLLGHAEPGAKVIKGQTARAVRPTMARLIGKDGALIAEVASTPASA